MSEVDLVINTFERNYRDVLRRGFFPAIEEQNRFRFAARVALINNVADRAAAADRAETLLATGEIDRYHFVDERLASALQLTGLTRRDLGRIPHYSDCALVAVTLPGSPWLLYWDADVHLRESVDWLSPALELSARDPRIMAANPAWWRGGVGRETIETTGPFALGHGFSDAVFLGRRADFARPIYRERCLASLRYPLAHIAADFEQRVDAYMRTHRRLRATHIGAVYEHPETEGAGYPAASAVERIRRWRNLLVVRLLGVLRSRRPTLRV